MERVSSTRETAAAAIDMSKLLAARRVAVSACPYLATALHAMPVHTELHSRCAQGTRVCAWIAA